MKTAKNVAGLERLLRIGLGLGLGGLALLGSGWSGLWRGLFGLFALSFVATALFGW
jgi:hypothetical protein